jgi:hypothetical protein
MGSPSASKVKGMDSFLRKQAKARELEEEKRERYAKAFLENLDDFDRRGRRTIPEPAPSPKTSSKRLRLDAKRWRRSTCGASWRSARGNRRRIILASLLVLNRNS